VTREDEDRQVAAVAERLASRHPEVPAETVDEIVREAREKFIDSPVRDFVPLLVERSARERIRRRRMVAARLVS
jgi:hypothetical protein